MVKIHIEVTDETRRKLRVKAALDDRTVQDVVARLIEKHLKDFRIPEGAR